MLVVTISATTDKDRELIRYLRDYICYHLDEELNIALQAKGWNGYSGGDDAYFGLSNKTVRVKVDEGL